LGLMSPTGGKLEKNNIVWAKGGPGSCEQTTVSIWQKEEKGKEKEGSIGNPGG